MNDINNNKDIWNGSGCHVNFSTKYMRTLNIQKPLGALYETAKIISNLKYNHSLDIPNYGLEDNKIRLSGRNETSSYDFFNYGVGNRNCSVRIPTSFVNNLCGYIEDRRPASNMNPYIVTRLITSACLLPSNIEDTINISNNILNNNLLNLSSN
jgi:glutamine synthetase